MPSIAHLVLGGFLAISLYYISDGKFSKTHAFIFFLNNYIGPDIGWLIGLGYYTHNLVSWFFFAMGLAIFYYYLTRFSFEIDGLRKIEIIDREKYKLSYLQTFCLVLAGGILHIYLDDTINYEGIYHIIPQLPMGFDGFAINLHEFASFGLEGVLNMNSIISLLFGLIFIIGFIFIFAYFLKYNTKKNGALIVLYIASFMAYFYLVGGASTGEHGDGGAIIYVSFYWITPLMLCMLSTKSLASRKKEGKEVKESDKIKRRLDVNTAKKAFLILGIITVIGGGLILILGGLYFDTLVEKEILETSYKETYLSALIVISIVITGIGTLIIMLWNKLGKTEDHHKNLWIISIWLFITGIIGTSLALVGLLLLDLLVSFIFSSYGILFWMYDVNLIVIIIGMLLLVLAIINFICAIGLLIKNKKIWRFSTFYHIFLLWSVIGLVIACALNENSVKELFLQKE